MLGNCLVSWSTISSFSRSGRINRLAACDLVFLVVFTLCCRVLPCAVVVSSGLLVCCCVVSTMYLCLYGDYCYCLVIVTISRTNFRILLWCFRLIWGLLNLPKFLLLGPCEPVAPTEVRLRATVTYT